MDAIGGTRLFYVETKRTDYEMGKYSNTTLKELCQKCGRHYKDVKAPQCTWCARKEVAKRQRARRLARMVVERADVKFYFRELEEDEPEL